MRSIRVYQFVKDNLENLKDELDLKSESELIYYLTVVFFEFREQITLNEHLRIRSDYLFQKDSEDTEKAALENID